MDLDRTVLFSILAGLITVLENQQTLLKEIGQTENLIVSTQNVVDMLTKLVKDSLVQIDEEEQFMELLKSEPVKMQGKY